MTRPKRSEMKYGGVARFGKGPTALMRVDRIDELCGYHQAYGVDISGGYIHRATEKMVPANAEDLRVWQNYKHERTNYNAD